MVSWVHFTIWCMEVVFFYHYFYSGLFVHLRTLIVNLFFSFLVQLWYYWERRLEAAYRDIEPSIKT